MRYRILSMSTVAFALVSAAVVGGPAAIASPRPVAARAVVTTAHHSPSSLPHSAASSCFSNANDDTGNGVLSQTFSDDGFDIYDSAGADDFTVLEDCVVTGIDVAGQYFNGIGPADSETVTFFADDAGQPGSVLAAQTVVGSDPTGTGSFAIPLSPIFLHAGQVYWVSVAANMAFETGGEWGWDTSATQSGNPAAWENPGDGLGTGCVTWTAMQTCVGSLGPDFVFDLAGDQNVSNDFAGYSGDLPTGAKRRGALVQVDYTWPDAQACSGHPDGILAISSIEVGGAQSRVTLEDVTTCVGEQPTFEYDWIKASFDKGYLRSGSFAARALPGQQVKQTLSQDGNAIVMRACCPSPRDPQSGLPTGRRFPGSGHPTTYSVGLTTVDRFGQPYDPQAFGSLLFSRCSIEKAPLGDLDPAAISLVDERGVTLAVPTAISGGTDFAVQYQE